MNMPNDEAAFCEDLARLEQDEAHAEISQQLIADKVEHLTSKGQDFYPFSHKNIVEALANIPEANMSVMSAFIGVIADESLCSNTAKAVCTDVILRLIREYWEDSAKQVIERDEP